MGRLLIGAFVLCMLVTFVCAPAAGAVGKYELAFWREIGMNENGGAGGGNHSIFVWVFDEQGNPKQGVKLYTTWDVLLATTDQDGRAEIVVDVNNDHYIVKCVDTAGSESDVTPIMTSRRWPNWGHYSYELGFMFKADKNNPGQFDTSLIGSVNTSTVFDNDAPATRSLCYYSTNPQDTYSDQFSLATWKPFHGQTFKATGDRIMAVQFHGSIGANYNLSWTAEILEDGPNGKRIAGPKSIPVRQPILWVLPFGVNEAPVEPGRTYFLKISRSGGLNTYTTGNNYLDGSYHDSLAPVPARDLQGFVCCMTYGESETGTLKGTVRSGGQPLPGAVVTVNPGNHSLQTQPDGTYTLTGLAPNSYTVSVWKPGYTSQESGPVSVVAQQESVADFDLTALTNLLQNPGFEAGTVNAPVPLPWVTFGSGLTTFSSLNWAIPSHGGSKFAGAISSYATKAGGILQTVSVTPGADYTASAYVFNDSWQGGDRQNEYPGNSLGRIGIDPTGGQNPSSGSVVWSPWNNAFNRWGLARVTATAAAQQMTVFLQYSQAVSYEWNKSAFDDVFLTRDQDLPNVQFVIGPNAGSIGTNSATITWSTNVVTSGRVDYGKTPAYGQSMATSGPATGHNVQLIGLEPGETYHYRVVASAEGYDSATSTDATFTTVSAPTVQILTGPSVVDATPTSVRVVWTTDLASTSTVQYGVSQAYGQTATGAGGVTSHSVLLTGLQGGQTYHYRVLSSAAGYADAISADATFETPVPPGTLRNPGFESQDAYWTRYGQFDDGGDNGIQSTAWYFDFNPHGGVNFAGSAASYGAKTGGFYQKVTAVPGQAYRLQAFVKTLNVGGDPSHTYNRVGIDTTGGTDRYGSKVVWSATASPTSWSPIEVCAVAEAAEITVFLDAVQTLPVEWNINAFDDVSLQTLQGGTVAAVKALADGTGVYVTGAVTTGQFPGFSYIQDPDGPGIRVSGVTPAMGQVVSVCGVLATANGERQINATCSSVSGTRALPRPMGMKNANVGGSDWNYNPGTGAGQKGVDNSSGPTNVGRIVRTWGSVSQASGNTFVLNDASGRPVKVVLPPWVALNPQWEWLMVSGVSSVWDSGNGTLLPQILVRSAADIRAL